MSSGAHFFSMKICGALLMISHVHVQLYRHTGSSSDRQGGNLQKWIQRPREFDSNCGFGKAALAASFWVSNDKRIFPTEFCHFFPAFELASARTGTSGGTVDL